MPLQPDPQLDLVLERTADVQPTFVWDAWTRPDLLKQWFCPKPWQTLDAEIDLRPGGIFRTVMQGPEGPAFANVGCILEVDPGRRLVWTSALGPDFRPKIAGPESPFGMTAIISIEPSGSGTKYTVTVLHGDAAIREQHVAMGFHQGWGTAFDQLVALAPAR